MFTFRQSEAKNHKNNLRIPRKTSHTLKYTESSNDELPEKKENKKKINLQHIEFLLLCYYYNVINYTNQC